MEYDISENVREMVEKTQNNLKVLRFIVPIYTKKKQTDINLSKLKKKKKQDENSSNQWIQRSARQKTTHTKKHISTVGFGFRCIFSCFIQRQFVF